MKKNLIIITILMLGGCVHQQTESERIIKEAMSKSSEQRQEERTEKWKKTYWTYEVYNSMSVDDIANHVEIDENTYRKKVSYKAKEISLPVWHFDISLNCGDYCDFQSGGYFLRGYKKGKSKTHQLYVNLSYETYGDSWRKYAKTATDVNGKVLKSQSVDLDLSCHSNSKWTFYEDIVVHLPNSC